MVESAGTRGKPESPESGDLLEVRDLHVAFPTDAGPVTPVRGVSFRVGRGQRVGIIGESGSGKSLTALAIMRLVRLPGRVVAGEVALNGRDLLSMSEREMARVRGGEVAMIYQNPLSALNPLQRIGDQIVEAIRAQEDVRLSAARARAIELLQAVGIPRPERRADSYPHEFSGGMRQRVVIAIALSANPDLLIADEPTTALDVTTQARILELLAQLVEERRTALVLITHDLGVAASVCTEMHVMYAGRVVEATNAGRLYVRPTHPYSEALLRSIVRLDADVERPIPAIPGQQPLPGQLPPGCPFHPRCPYAADVCRAVEPAPVRLGDPVEVVAECHFAEERFGTTVAAEARR